MAENSRATPSDTPPDAFSEIEGNPPDVVEDPMGSSRTYCYLADSDEFSEGDLVVVPAGPDNRETVVRIESIEYHPAEEAPFPLEKTKHILRKFQREE